MAASLANLRRSKADAPRNGLGPGRRRRRRGSRIHEIRLDCQTNADTRVVQASPAPNWQAKDVVRHRPAQVFCVPNGCGLRPWFLGNHSNSSNHSMGASWASWASHRSILSQNKHCQQTSKGISFDHCSRHLFSNKSPLGRVWVRPTCRMELELVDELLEELAQRVCSTVSIYGCKNPLEMAM